MESRKSKHKEIRDLIEKFLEENELNSWTVHKNRRGKVLTLRFVDSEDEDTNGTNVSFDRRQTFVRKSDKQIQRSRNRLGLSMQTRSKVQREKSIEKPRKAERKMHENYDVTNHFSPVSVDAGGSSDSDSDKDVLHNSPFTVMRTPLLTESVDLFASPVLSTPSNDDKSSKKKNECPVLPCAVLQNASEIKMPEIHASCPTSTCDDESDPYEGSCSDRECSYWTPSGYGLSCNDTKVHRTAHYHCQRCDLSVCSKCHVVGKHKRHKRYLRNKSDYEGT